MIYLANILKLNCEDLEKLVSEERIKYASKYKFEIDRRRSLAVEALLNAALKSEGYNGDWPVRVGHEKNWRPYFMGEVILPGYEQVYFSLSHAGDYVAAVIDCKPVGIDIEMIKAHNKLIEEKYFSEGEQKLIEEDPDGSEVGFFRLWTMKEAFLKSIGGGLGYGIDKFTLTKASGETDNIYEVEHSHDEYSYKGYSLPAPDGYAMSVCTRYTLQIDDAYDKIQYIDLCGE